VAATSETAAARLDAFRCVRQHFALASGVQRVPAKYLSETAPATEAVV
jgi:hypothetical protein